jgi:hypothetical protein
MRVRAFRINGILYVSSGHFGRATTRISESGSYGNQRKEFPYQKESEIRLPTEKKTMSYHYFDHVELRNK